MHAAQNTLESQQRRGAALHAAHGSVTVVRCSCGQAQAYEDKPTGGTRKAARTLIGIFRYFHEQHGGTVTVESQNGQKRNTSEAS